MPKPTLHFETLRRIAETASGMRYTSTWFECREENGELHVRISDEPVAPTDDTTVISYTGWARPDIPPVTSANIASGQVQVDLLNLTVPADPAEGWAPRSGVPADAVFWSASAVEKFLVPYYASVYGDRAAPIVSNLISLFVPPGSPELGPSDSAATPVEDPVFAVVHLPSSEYGRTELPDEGGSGGTGEAFAGGARHGTRLYRLHLSGKVSPLA